MFDTTHICRRGPGGRLLVAWGSLHTRWRSHKPRSLACADRRRVLAGGLLFCGVPAVASAAGGSPPEQPLTEGCQGSTDREAWQLCGTLNPHSSAKVGYYFAYNTGTSCTGGSKTYREPEVEGEALKVSGEAVDITPHTLYSYCLVATNSAGEETAGRALTVMTEAQAPVVGDESAHMTGPVSAELEAQIAPRNEATSYFFEYASNASLAGAELLPGGELAAVLGLQPVAASISAGLVPNTVYYYWAVASSEAGTRQGPVASFTTPPIPPQVATGPVESVGASTATLTGMLNPLHTSTSYWFQYGTSEAYGASLPATSAGSGVGAVPEAVAVSGLTPDATYHFRLDASNAGGTTYGTDQTFTTAPASQQPLTQSPPDTGPATITPPLVLTVLPPPKKLVSVHFKTHKRHQRTKRHKKTTSQRGRVNKKGKQHKLR